MSVNEDLIDTSKEGHQDTEFIETLYTYLRYWKWFLFSILFS